MHTVIVGGGFAGVRAALELSKKQLGKITLISDEPYFLYHAALYATATGRDTAASVVALQDVFAAHHDVEVVLDSMQTIDKTRKLVVGSKAQYPYDNLIIAIGVVTTYFGIKGMDAHSYGIKTLNDVKEFKNHLHTVVAEDKHMDKNYVVIGGGLTGVELAGSLAQYLREIANAHKVRRAKIAITLVEAAPRLVPRLSETASQKIHQRLESLGVKILVNNKVESLEKDTIVIEGKKIPTETAIWTSGVANHPFFAKHADIFPLAKNGRVEVNSYMQACGCGDIYVIGDNANTKYTGTAITALYDAVFIADHLARKTTQRPLVRYTPKLFTNSIPVGDNWAYVEKHNIYLVGRSGYFVRRMIELGALKKLLPANQALSMWRAHLERTEDECTVCKSQLTSGL